MDRLLVTRALEYIESDFQSRPDFARACTSVITYLSAEDERNLRHLTFGDISRAVSSQAEPNLVSSVIAYLAGARAKVLDLRFEFIDGDEIFQVSADEIREAKEEKVFIHPSLGTQVFNFEERVFVYFVPCGSGEERE